jgi:hypothetical protein
MDQIAILRKSGFGESKPASHKVAWRKQGRCCRWSRPLTRGTGPQADQAASHIFAEAYRLAPNPWSSRKANALAAVGARPKLLIELQACGSPHLLGYVAAKRAQLCSAFSTRPHSRQAEANLHHRQTDPLIERGEIL